jgi:hypothetical protein
MRNLFQRRIRHDHQHTPWYELWRQPLAMLIRMPWWLFFPVMILIYLAVILAFAIVLSFDRRHLLGEAPMGIPRPLVFASESFFANGFSSVTPDSLFTYAIGVLSLIAGLITLSTLTAIVFARLSSNETPLRFSRHLCISSMDNGHLFCRFVTADPSQWLNVSYGLSLIYDDQVEPELWQRRIVPLELLNSVTPQLSQTATLTHPLTASSPIVRYGLNELARRNAVIMPLVEGVDESTGSGLLQTYLYKAGDIQLGRRFADLVSADHSGQRRINLRRLNDLL